MKKYLLLLLPFLSLAFVGGDRSIDPNKIPGVWKMSKHTYMDSGMKKQCDFHLHMPMLQINRDSTYSVKIKGQIVEKGKWRFKEPASLLFYNCKDVPDDPLVSIEDHISLVVSVRETLLKLTEYQCSKKTEGESLYEKLK